MNTTNISTMTKPGITLDNTGRLSVDPSQTPTGNGMPFAMPVQEDPFAIPYERERRALADRYRRYRRMENLRSVCLYSKDAKYKDKVPGDLGYLLSDRALSDRDGQDLLLGDEIAATVAGGDVYGAIKSYIGTVPQERQAEYKEKLSGCKTEADGKRMLGGMFRERVNTEYEKDEQRAARFKELTTNAQNIITKRLMGDCSEPLPDDKSDADVEVKAWMASRFESDADRKGYEKACQAMALIRAQQQKKVKLYIHESGFVDEKAYNEGDILKLRDAVADHLLDGRGELDEAALKWFRKGLSGFAAELNGRDPGAAERFAISMRQMMGNIGAFVEDEDLSTATLGSVSAMPSLGLPTGEGIPWAGSDFERTKKESRKALLDNDARLNAADPKRVKRMLIGGEMNKAIRRGLEFKDGMAWWEQAYKGAAQMAPQTLPWLVPYVGMPLGAATSYTSQHEEGFSTGIADFHEKHGRMPNPYEMAGLNMRAAEDASIGTVVEILPGQVVGVPFTRWMSKLAGVKGAVGSFARGVARLGERRWGAVGMDFAAGVFEEAVFEPVAQGILTYGADAMMDMAGVPAVNRRGVGEVFAELKENVKNPGQLGAVALTVAVLGGGNLPNTFKTSDMLREHSGLLLAAGMSEADVAKVRLSDTPAETAAELYAKALEDDMPAVLERIKAEAVRNNTSGDLLRKTGRQDVGDADLQRSLKASWDYLAEQGVLPQVEERPDGRFHVAKKVLGENGTVTLKEFDLEAAEADAFIAMCVSDAQAVCVGAMQADVWGLQQEAVRQIYGEAAARAIFQNGKSHGVFIEEVADVEGMTPELAEEARNNRFAMTAEWLGKAAAQLGGKWVERAEKFKQRLDLEGLAYDKAGSRLFRDRVDKQVEFGVRSVWGSVLTYVRGQATVSDAVEDVFESFTDMQIAARAEELMERQEGASANADVPDSTVETHWYDGHLDDEIEPILIDSADSKSVEDLYEDFKDYYRNELAGKEIEIGSTGWSMVFGEGKKSVDTAAKGVNRPRRHAAGKKIAEALSKAFHMGSTTPVHKPGEGKKKSKMVDHTGSFERFGYPIILNGEKRILWMEGATKKGSTEKIARFYEFGISDEKTATPGVKESSSHRPGVTQNSDKATLGDFLGVVKGESQQKSVAMSAKEAWGQAVREMAAKVKPVIEGMALLSDSPQLEAMARDENWTEDRLYMSTLEAMSHIAKSGYLAKADALPSSWKAGLDAAYDVLDYTQEMKQFADAYKALKDAGTVDVAPLEDVLAKQGVLVDDVFRDARVDAQVVESWRKAKGVVAARAAVEGTGAVGVQEALESAEESEREIAEAEAARAAVPPLSEVEQREAATQLNEELASTPPPPVFSAAPEAMRGVFRDDSCTCYAGGFYSGWVAVDKLRDSAEIQQVKVGDKGKHGVTNALVGEFQLSAPPIIVWRRKNGDLEVISGRHRYALAEARGVKFMRADVYNEDAEHNAKWARLMDFENNMRDDQADEKTAFIYVRETGYDDETLHNKGLLRNKTKSKRGAMIARHAREELATRFMNDAVSAKDAETIVCMTKDIADKGRIEEIQRRCCMLLDERKSWEYIGAMVQLMASKESVFLKQGLLDLGADFEADLARAAKYIETCTRQLNEAIAVMKSGRKMSGKQAELARRLGQLTTSAEDSQQRLDALMTMKSMFDNIGMYPDLVAGAQMWDGKTEVDAVGMALNRGMQEVQENEAEEAMSVEERLAKAEAEAARKAAEEATGSLFSFSVTPEMEDIKSRAVADGSFMKAPNGKPTNLTERQWLQVRTKAFKEWFGDWERAAKLTFVSGSAKDSDVKPSIKEWQGQKITNSDSKIEAYLNSDGANKIISKAAKEVSQANGFTYAQHNAVAAQIGVLYQHALYIGAYKDKNGTKTLTMHRFTCPIVIDGQKALAFLTVKETNKTTIYSVETLEIKGLAHKVGGIAHLAKEPPAASPERIVPRVNSAVKTYFDDVSKIVDGNGEPKVVTHSTTSEPFAVFRRGVKSGLSGKGIYFSPDKVALWGHNVMSCFLNVKHPMTKQNAPYEVNRGGMAAVDPDVFEHYPQFDGVMIRRDEITVRDPEQIKSATDNRGTFDAGNADITFSVTIPTDRVCRTRAEARRMVGRKGEPLHLENRSLELEAVFNSKSDGKFNDRDSIGRSIAMLTEDGLSVEEAKTAHYTAYGNIAELFANGERMEFERAYKKKDVRKGFLHVYSPFDIEGRAGEYESNIELEIHQEKGHKPTAYLLNVYIQKRKPAIESGGDFSEPHAVPTSSVADIEADFPGFVKRGGKKFSGSFSVMTESQRREAVKNELARVAAMDKQVAGLAEDWERVLGDLVRVSRGGEEVKLGDGARLYAEMLSLISATRAVLPPHLANMGHLNMLLHWAAAYAEMVQHGELPLRGGVIKGAIAEKLLASMQKKRDALLLQGLSEQEAREAMAQIGAEKLNRSLKKVAEACRDQLNRYVKERAWERIQALAQRAMPKSEPGHRSHKGKMDAEHYKELSAVLHALNLTEEGLEKEQSELKGRIDALTGTEEGYEEKYQELQDALNRLNLYGCWHSMSASHALKAAGAFAAFVQEGRQQWKETLEIQRRRKLWLMGRMSEGMKKAATANAVIEEQNTDAVGVLRAPARGAKDFVYGLMNMSHLVQAKKRELGDAMVVHLQNMLLHAQEGKHREKSRRDGRIAELLRIFYNCKNEADVTRTLNELQRRRVDHGIRTWKLEKHTYTLDRAEAEDWAAMTPDAREKVRERERAEAEEKKLAPPERVAEADIERLKEVLMEMNTRTRTLKNGTVKAAPSEAKTVRLTVQRWNKKQAETLEVSRLNVANALLILEQPGYEHLVEDWGLVRYNAAGAELHPDSKEFETGYDLEATLKPLYDFVGDTCMDFCYEMRHYIDAYVRPLTEEAYNRRMGIPLRTLPLYWPGTFNISTMSAKDVLTENGGSALGQSASFTINRVYKHHAAADWNKDALEVFYRATDEQLNYVYTGELTQELRDMFMNDAFVKKLEVNCGAQWVRAVKDRILILDNSVALDAVNMQAMGKVLSRFFGQLAKDALSFNPNSYTKQASGILNGLTAGMVPRRVIERSGGAKELAYSKAGILEWAAALGRVSLGKGCVSIEALRKREFWRQRFNDPRIQERLRKAAALGSARQSVHAGVVADAGMRAMGAIDRACNAPGLLALADVFYRRLEKLNAEHGLGLTPAGMEEQALDAVGRALDVGAQPMTAEQKAGMLASGSGMSRFVLNTATMFKSEIFKDLAQLSSQCMSGQWGAALSHYMLRGSFNYGVVCLLALLRFGGDDDDNEDEDGTWVKVVKFVTASLTSDLAAVPVFGELPGSVYNWASGRGSWQQSVPVVGDIQMAYKSAVKLAEKGDAMEAADMVKHCKRIMRGLALLLVPACFSQRRWGSVSDAVLDASVIMNPVKMGTEVHKAHVQED